MSNSLVRKKYARRAAMLYSFLVTYKINDMNPFDWLRLTVILIIFLFTSCSGQKQLKTELIFNSKVNNEVVLAIKNLDSTYFSNKYEWFAYKNLSIWCLDSNGIKYIFNYDNNQLSKVNGTFKYDLKIYNPDDYFGKVEYNFYFDKNTIGWLTLTKDPNIEIVRTVDIEKGTQQEATFHIPKSLQDYQPIILSPNKLLYHNYVLNSDNTIDTLEVGDGVSFPHFDRVYMRKNSFMVDKYFELENLQQDDVSPIDFIKVEGKRMVAQKVDPPNVNIANYRVEANHDNIWFFSHKISPEKFLLYDVNSKKAFPFELDKSVFKLENMYLIELEPDIEDPYDVKFSYHTSMSDNSIYIYIIKDGIKLYKVSDYRRLLK